jgi:hypothetical protein
MMLPSDAFQSKEIRPRRKCCFRNVQPESGQEVAAKWNSYPANAEMKRFRPGDGESAKARDFAACYMPSAAQTSSPVSSFF